MRRFAALPAIVLAAIVLLAMALFVVARSPEADVTGSVKRCATELYPSYNPKAHDQCMAACIKCERGNTTTCSTSCMLKGAR